MKRIIHLLIVGLSIFFAAYLFPDLVKVNEYFNITTSPENATIVIDDYLVSYPYFISYPGDHLIKASKEGYIPSNKSITAEEPSYIKDSISEDEIKLGKKVWFEFTKNGTWEVKYQENYTTAEELIKEGVGESTEFKLKEGGFYNIYLDGKLVKRIIIEQKRGFFRKYWFWIILAVIIIAGVGIFIYTRLKSGEEKTPSYEYKV